jgi:hypothetical protein
MLAVFRDTYYATAATVIPLFMFLIVFERRLLTVDLSRGRWYSTFEVATMPLFVLLFIGGEWSALAALKHGHASGLEDGLVTLTFASELAALLLLGIGVVLAPALRGRLTLRTGDPPDDDAPAGP